MVVGMGVDTTSDFYDSRGRPFRSRKAKGVANHRDGGCDPTELALTVQPANTAQPVETTTTILPQPVMGLDVWPHPLHGGSVIGRRCTHVSASLADGAPVQSLSLATHQINSF